MDTSMAANSAFFNRSHRSLPRDDIITATGAGGGDNSDSRLNTKASLTASCSHRLAADYCSKLQIGGKFDVVGYNKHLKVREKAQRLAAQQQRGPGA